MRRIESAIAFSWVLSFSDRQFVPRLTLAQPSPRPDGGSGRIVRLAGHAEGLLAEAFARAPPGVLEQHVVQRAAGVVIELPPRMLRAPTLHQLSAGAIPRNLEGPSLEALDPPALVADAGPQLIRMADVVLPIEQPELSALHVAEDEE